MLATDGAARTARGATLRFRSQLAHGAKKPYTTWTFLIVPEAVVEAAGRERFDVRGELEGVAFTGTVAKVEGVFRIPIPRDVLARAPEGIRGKRYPNE